VRRSLRFAGLCTAAAVICGTGAAGVGGRNEVASACPATATFPDEPADHTPSWSPDGRSVAFASNRDGTFQIYVLNVTDCAVRQITRGTTFAYGPDWSPDGRRLVFERNDGGDSDLWIVAADGSGLRRLTRGPSTPRRESFDLFPDWSRRGVIASPATRAAKLPGRKSATSTSSGRTGAGSAA
jgi:dipeptidyl aminopeptidase/acylaminoacyl peptidase